ncbi:hypothetical protein [Neobacillus ginsengisoli]|nr:hypothetical protein [Neobacillus ginsengisoli]
MKKNKAIPKSISRKLMRNCRPYFPGQHGIGHHAGAMIKTGDLLVELGEI